MPTDFYKPLFGVKQELEQRRNNKTLKHAVEEFMGEFLLPQFRERPRAVFSRSITTPNMELQYFLEIIDTLDIEPLFLEYPSKFVAKNFEKYHLCQLHFASKDKPNDHRVIKIVDFEKMEGKPLREVTTVTGRNVVDLHHKMFDVKYPHLSKHIYDFSDFFDRTRYKTEYYYLYYLALFVCHGILFDNYLFNDKTEASFIAEKVLPSFNKVKELFGVAPLIVPLLSFATEQDKQWHWYDDCHYDIFMKESV